MDHIRSIIALGLFCLLGLKIASAADEMPKPPYVLDQLSEYKSWADRQKRSDLESIEIKLRDVSAAAFWSIDSEGRSIGHVYLFNRAHSNWEIAADVHATKGDRIANAVLNRQEKTLLFEDQNGHLSCSTNLNDADRLINGGTPVTGNRPSRATNERAPEPEGKKEP